jgi:hypothetical protein
VCSEEGRNDGSKSIVKFHPRFSLLRPIKDLKTEGKRWLPLSKSTPPPPTLEEEEEEEAELPAVVRLEEKEGAAVLALLVSSVSCEKNDNTETERES